MTGYESKKKAAQAKLDSMEREALKLALEALEAAEIDGNCEYGATEIIRKALAQPEQEPAAWMKASDIEWSMSFFEEDGYVPLYTAPPQRTWVELTEDEYNDIWRMDLNNRDLMDRTIEALKEKNNG